jgi:transcription elongation GreA/GreB family factor
MTEDIKKAVESGKLTSTAGAALAKLPPGTFVQHKSWGYGVIVAHDFLLSQTTIDFKTKKGHPMQLQYAGESLAPLPVGHIAEKKFRDLDGVRKLGQSDPAALVRLVLQSLGGRATADHIATQLVPDVFNDAIFKKWWESAKRALKSDPLVGVPQKKTEPFILRKQALSQTDEVLDGFKAARTLKDQIGALDNLTKALGQFSDPSVLQPIVAAVESAAKKNLKLHTAETLQLLVQRDEIVAKFPALASASDTPTTAAILVENDRQLTALLGELPVSKLKKVILALPDAFSDHWSTKAVGLFMRGNAKVVPEAARLLIEKGRMDEFGTALDRSIRDQSISSEGLQWLCEERHGVYGEIAQHPRVLSAILSAMERDQFKEKRDRKLQDMLVNDQELILDLVSIATDEELRDVMRKLVLSPTFEELNKRSLLGRIVRTYPELETLITGRPDDDKKNELIVSWKSLEVRKEEYDDLVTKKIPQNRQDIQIARSYGDLRENFEYKSAKEQQRVLSRRKSELERDLARSRGTDFAGVTNEKVAIGTVVKLRRVSDGGEEAYTVLGAWDTDPEKHIISYLSQMAQALIGHAVGERVIVPKETGEHEVEILGIEVAKI